MRGGAGGWGSLVRSVSVAVVGSVRPGSVGPAGLRSRQFVPVPGSVRSARHGSEQCHVCCGTDVVAPTCEKSFGCFETCLNVLKKKQPTHTHTHTLLI